MSLARILEEALMLDEPQRAHLVHVLAASLDGVELNEDWEREIQRRIDDLQSGRVKAVPGSEVFARLERRFRAL